MKPKNRTRLRLLTFAVLSFISSDMARAASQTYDSANLSNVWDTSTTNWDSSTAFWINGNDAIFSGVGEVVTLTSVTAHNLSFGSTGFSLTGGTLTLTGSTPTLTAGSGVNASIASIIAGSNGLTKDGDGTVILTGANTYTGGTTVSAGTLQIGTGAGTGTINGSYSIGSGATLKLFRNVSAVNTTYSGAGSLWLQGTSTSVDWGQAALDGTFKGTIVVGSGRLYNNIAGSSTGLGGATALQINAGGQFGIFAAGGNYNVPLFIAGTGSTIDATPYGALRLDAGQTWSGNITLTANARIANHNQTVGSTISGNISGAYELELFSDNANATGSQIFLSPSSPNSYSSTRISGNVIAVANNANAFSTGGLVMSNTGTLKLNNNSLGFANLSGTTGTIQNGGTTTDSVITIGSDNTSTSYGGALLNGSTAKLGLTKIGNGTLTLTGANSYGGGTTVTAGILQIGSGAVNGTIGSGTYSIAGGAGLYLNYATAAAPTWANITGNGVLELNSAQAVNGSANWGAPALPAGMTGTLKVDRGRINGVPANFGGAANVVIGDGAQLLAYDGSNAGAAYTYTQNFSLSGMGWGESGHNLGAVRVSGMNATLSGNVTLTGNAGLYTQSASANSSLNLTGVIADGGGGYGLTINAGSNPITLSGANTYGGNTVITIGTLKLGAAGVIPDGTGKGNVTVTSTLDLNAFNETINGLSGAGTIDTLAGGTPVLTVGNNDQTGTFSGIIRNTAGTLALTKVGTGTQTLSGTCTYTGITSINAGKLVLGDAATDTFATTQVNVAIAAMLLGSGTIAGNVTLAAESGGGAKNGGTLAPGNSPGILRVNGDTTFNQGSIFSWDLSVAGSNSSVTSQDGLRGTAYDGATVNGNLTGSNAVFKIVLGGTESFADSFWSSNRTWSNIFTTGNLNWAGIFTSLDYSAAGGAPDALTQGSFTLTGSSLAWSVVPEPTSALAGLLIGAALLRRRRVG